MHAVSTDQSARRDGWAAGDGAEPRQGVVRAIVFEKAEGETCFRVLRVHVDGAEEPATWVGVVPVVQPGMRVQGLGIDETDRKRGASQFKLTALMPLIPKTVEGLVAYLGSGVIDGIGPALATEIVRCFGTRTLEVLDAAPERLREVDGIGPVRAESMAASWKLQRGAGTLAAMLAGYGVTGATAARVLKRYGDQALATVQRDPYALALEVRGIGFKIADAIATRNDVAADSPKRTQAGVMQALHDAESDGHTVVPRRSLLYRARKLLGTADVDAIDAAVEALVAAGHVIVCDEATYARRETAAIEAEIATCIARLLAAAPTAAKLDADGAIAAFEKKRGVTLAPAQRDAVHVVAASKVAVITGGPGVGKTTLVLALLDLFRDAKLRVKLASPTGRAAKRMNETTGHAATTIHRLLEFEPRSGRFMRDATYSIGCDVLIVDEASMLDVSLARDLLVAVPHAARVVFVGDVDQLPSVGHGAVLRDLICSEVVPTVRLTTIFRQAAGSLIVANAHAINQGRLPVSSPDGGGDFFVIKTSDEEKAAARVVEIVTQRLPRRGFDPADVLVLVPMHRGPAGTRALNEALQAAVNPAQRGEPEIRRKDAHGVLVYRPRDKVLVTRNDAQRDVYNGDSGVITSIESVGNAKRVRVRFDEERASVIFEEREVGGMLTLAYASSIHRAQGSEAPAVIVVLQKAHAHMAERKLVYTAVTRGKRLVALVADPETLAHAVQRSRSGERRTRLMERLREQMRRTT